MKYINYHKGQNTHYVNIPTSLARELGVSRQIGKRKDLVDAVKLRDTFFSKYGLTSEGTKRVVGVIGDTHFPFTHSRYLEFCKDTFDRHKVTDVVHIGDIVDNHAISRHKTEPIADGVVTEYMKAKQLIREWATVFPDMKIVVGNHDAILERQASELGVPPFYLKTPQELYEMPDGWTIDESVILDDVLYKHGVGSGGMHGAYNSAKRQCMSVVQGHTHSYAGVKYISTPQKLWFGMSVGCGIDIDAYAFTYGKYFENRPILGCGIVYDSREGVFVPMDLDKYSKTGKV